jgi:hypothetical protein
LLAIFLLGQLLSVKEWVGFIVILLSVLTFEILSGTESDKPKNL